MLFKPAGKEIEIKDPSEYKAEEKEEPVYAAKGEVAPDITIKKLDDTEAVVSDYFGKPTIMTFWATWCGYCVSETAWHFRCFRINTVTI